MCQSTNKCHPGPIEHCTAHRTILLEHHDRLSHTVQVFQHFQLQKLESNGSCMLYDDATKTIPKLNRITSNTELHLLNYILHTSFSLSNSLQIEHLLILLSLLAYECSALMTKFLLSEHCFGQYQRVCRNN